MDTKLHPETARRLKILADRLGPFPAETALRIAKRVDRRVKDEIFAIHGQRWLEVWRNQLWRG